MSLCFIEFTFLKDVLCPPSVLQGQSKLCVTYAPSQNTKRALTFFLKANTQIDMSEITMWLTKWMQIVKQQWKIEGLLICFSFYLVQLFTVATTVTTHFLFKFSMHLHIFQWLYWWKQCKNRCSVTLTIDFPSCWCGYRNNPPKRTSESLIGFH